MSSQQALPKQLIFKPDMPIIKPPEMKQLELSKFDPQITSRNTSPIEGRDANNRYMGSAVKQK